jgi:hypothetical protein
MSAPMWRSSGDYAPDAVAVKEEKAEKDGR